MKFTPVGGRIVIETRTQLERNVLAVSISDTGIGMVAEELARIFEVFSQGDHALQVPHRFGGMGLGLAISRTMVELHSGTIRAVSGGRNQGATFIVELPLLQGVRAEDSSEDLAGNPLVQAGLNPGKSMRRILLVEDDKPTSRALMKLLVRRNYEVVSADCLAEALAAAGRETFDLLISDIGLPDGNGYELMSEVRRQYGLIGIALTGYGMEEDVNRSQAAGFAAHLTKPVSIQALDAALTSLRPYSRERGN